MNQNYNGLNNGAVNDWLYANDNDDNLSSSRSQRKSEFSDDSNDSLDREFARMQRDSQRRFKRYLCLRTRSKDTGNRKKKKRKNAYPRVTWEDIKVHDIDIKLFQSAFNCSPKTLTGL